MNGPARWLWVRCLMDQQLYLLDRQQVLDLAEVGCALARCGVLLLIPEVALYPAGQPCPTCLAGLQSSRCGVARFRDHPRGSLVCPACAGAVDGGPLAGWPPVELPTRIPGGQPVPSPAQRRPMGPVPVPPPRFSHPAPAHRSDPGIPTPVPDQALGPHREAESATLRWGCCPADRLLHLLDPRAVREATAVGWAKAHCGRLILAANLTLCGDSVGMCVGCVAAGSAP